jgi:tetratricopeptide (TPR) repeat protein
MRSLRAALVATPFLLSFGCTTAQVHEKALLNNELCVQQLQGGDVRQAEIYCDLGLEYSPNYADLWVNKGLIALSRGNPKEAKDDFIKALRINNDHAAAHMNLGRVYLNEGAQGKAHDSFVRALQVNPEYLEARYNLGLTLMNLGKLDRAEKEMRTLLAVNPNIAEVHHDLGIIRYRQGEKVEAAEYMTRAVELAPNLNAEWWNDLGAVLMELSRFALAKQAFSSCLAIKPDHPLCLDNLSIAQRKAALVESGVDKDTAKAENTPSALFMLARNYHQRGLLAEEERTYKDCINLDGKYAPCHYGLFQIYSDAHKRESAVVACKNFLKYAPVEDFPTEYETCEKFLRAKSN